ncbi:hypothetical protein M3Y99_01815500 [Aphelenchoides fujianensis]|nr:hypothetical protein M3Y99_01815500 [Aphelenchoides fujianensis]
MPTATEWAGGHQQPQQPQPPAQQQQEGAFGHWEWDNYAWHWHWHWSCWCWNIWWCPPCHHQPTPPPPTDYPTTRLPSTSQPTTQTTTTTLAVTTTTPEQCDNTPPKYTLSATTCAGTPASACNIPEGDTSLVVDCDPFTSTYLNRGNESGRLEPTDQCTNCTGNRGRRYFFRSTTATTMTEAEANGDSLVFVTPAPLTWWALDRVYCTNTTYCCRPDISSVDTPEDETGHVPYSVDRVVLVPHCDSDGCWFRGDVQGTPGVNLTCASNSGGGFVDIERYDSSKQNPADFTTYLKVQYISCRDALFVVDANC